MFLDSSLETSLVYQSIMGASKELPLWEQYQEEDDPSTHYKEQKQRVRVRICPYERNIKKKMIKAQIRRSKNSWCE